MIVGMKIILCFPRNYVEDNFGLCKRIVLDIRDILASDIIYSHMLLYRNSDNGYDNICVIESKFYNSQFKEIKQM